MTEITRELMYGKRPVRRTEPKAGQSEWYYLDPRGSKSVSDRKEIDVPSENSPNPYANEIQNYLYQNDAYNYKQLYGDTPPVMNQQVLAPIDNTNSYKTESSWGYPNNTQSPYYQQMGKPYSSQPISKYRIGSLSSSMESHGDPSIIGTDNAGGPSYGLYQIATNPGTMKLYIKYLQKSPQYEIYADLLNQAGGNEGAKNKSKQFVDMWKKLSKDDSFNDSQFNFIVDTHLSPLIDKAKLPELLDIEHRHPVVKDALYSISVQHAGALKILNDTLIELYQHYGDNVDDETLLKTLYKNRTEYVRALKESERPGDNRITKREKENIIYKRYPEELQKALRYLK